MIWFLDEPVDYVLEECRAERLAKKDMALPLCEKCGENSIMTLFGMPIEIVDVGKICQSCFAKFPKART